MLLQTELQAMKISRRTDPYIYPITPLSYIRTNRPLSDHIAIVDAPVSL